MYRNSEICVAAAFLIYNQFQRIGYRKWLVRWFFFLSRLSILLATTIRCAAFQLNKHMRICVVHLPIALEIVSLQTIHSDWVFLFKIKMINDFDELNEKSVWCKKWRDLLKISRLQKKPINRCIYIFVQANVLHSHISGKWVLKIWNMLKKFRDIRKRCLKCLVTKWIRSDAMLYLQVIMRFFGHVHFSHSSYVRLQDKNFRC